MAGQSADPSGAGAFGAETAAVLSARLRAVYRGRGLSNSQLDALARALPRSTVSDMLNGKVPARETLLTFLAVCEVGAADQERWLAAWQRVRDGDWRRPPGGVRVRDASPGELGVHAAIQRPYAAGELPA